MTEALPHLDGITGGMACDQLFRCSNPLALSLMMSVHVNGGVGVVVGALSRWIF